MKLEHIARMTPITAWTRFVAVRVADDVTEIRGVATDGRTGVWAYRFDASIMSAKQAEEWLTANGRKPLSFTPAAMECSERGIVELAHPACVVLDAAGELVELAAADGGTTSRAFSMTAYTGAAMQLPISYRPVVVDISGVSVPRQSLPILRQHDSERILGHSESVDTSAQQIKASGKLLAVHPSAAEAIQLADGGFPWQASIGASIQKMEYVDAGSTAKVNGKTFNGPIAIARATTLREISFVPLGADHNTSANVKSE